MIHQLLQVHFEFVYYQILVILQAKNSNEDIEKYLNRFLTFVTTTFKRCCNDSAKKLQFSNEKKILIIQKHIRFKSLLLSTSCPWLEISIINVYLVFRSIGVDFNCSCSSVRVGVEGLSGFCSSIIDESGLIVVTNIDVGCGGDLLSTFSIFGDELEDLLCWFDCLKIRFSISIRHLRTLASAPNIL